MGVHDVAIGGYAVTIHGLWPGVVFALRTTSCGLAKSRPSCRGSSAGSTVQSQRATCAMARFEGTRPTDDCC